MKKTRSIRLVIGLIAVFALFQWTATVLESERGEAGVLVALIVVAALLSAEKLLFGRSLKDSVSAIGLTRPKKTGLLTALVIGGSMLLTIPVFAALTDSVFGFYPGWLRLVPGLFFQAGIAEEALFRGYLFGHLRETMTFRQAAVWAALPFILVHLILFFSLPWPLAAASILLSVVMSFPLSRLFETGGNTIWPPAIVHFVTQGTVKILVASGASAELFPFFWIAVCALLPFSVFALKSSRE